MNAMIKEVLAQGDFGSLQSLALIIFVFMMVFISLWIYLPGGRGYYQKIADSVLEEDRG